MRRPVITSSLLLLFLSAPLACGDGLSVEDAEQECRVLEQEAEQKQMGAIECDWDQGACVACFEACGNACAFAETVCPRSDAFSCPE